MGHHVSGSKADDGESQKDQSTTSAPEIAAPGGTSSKLRRGQQWIVRELERPGVGAVAIGAALVVAAATAGVSETLVGAIGAYAVYRILRRRGRERARS